MLTQKIADKKLKTLCTKAIILLPALLFLSSCSTKLRSVTNTDNEKVYTPVEVNNDFIFFRFASTSQGLPGVKCANPNFIFTILSNPQVTDPKKPSCAFLFQNNTPHNIPISKPNGDNYTMMQCSIAGSNGPLLLYWLFPLDRTAPFDILANQEGGFGVYDPITQCPAGKDFVCTFWNNTLEPDSCTGIVI